MRQDWSGLGKRRKIERMLSAMLRGFVLLVKSKGLIGLHNFTGADWGGKCVGISKETWIKSYLLLDDPDVIVTSFQALGTFDLSQNGFTNGKLPTSLVPLEAFACKVYAPKMKIESIPMLRWELYRSRNI